MVQFLHEKVQAQLQLKNLKKIKITINVNKENDFNDVTKLSRSAPAQPECICTFILFLRENDLELMFYFTNIFIFMII